ncbi:MAG: YmfQ family protein [Lachnospiraceae bacterium]|nr:YmfQ family protein [Lachnospiraceae bacterium]
MQIINYYPPVVSQVKEIQRIAAAEDREFSKLAAASAGVLRNMFISTADEDGITRFEKLSGITPDTSMTLEERKMHILAVANKCKMTLLELMFMLSAYPGSINLVCDYNTSELFVDMGEDVTGTGVIYGILDSFLPLHVYIIFALEFETATGFTEMSRNLEMETAISWWKAAWYLDGSVKLDGSRKLDAVLWEQTVILEMETFQSTEEIFKAENLLYEAYAISRITDSHKSLILETGIKQDAQEPVRKAVLGMETLQDTIENFNIENLLYEIYIISRIAEDHEGAVFETDVQTDTQNDVWQQETGIILEMFTETEEVFTDVSLDAERNLWYLDGSVKLDGSRKLNAKKTEEVL